ncbi:hypothetical protein AQ928_27825, partial [Burkholderia pseudomallei]
PPPPDSTRPIAGWRGPPPSGMQTRVSVAAGVGAAAMDAEAPAAAGVAAVGVVGAEGAPAPASGAV